MSVNGQIICGLFFQEKQRKNERKKEGRKKNGGGRKGPTTWVHLRNTVHFPGGSGSKESTCNAGDLGPIPELGRSPGEGSGYPLQSSCLEKPLDRGT